MTLIQQYPTPWSVVNTQQNYWIVDANGKPVYLNSREAVETITDCVNHMNEKKVESEQDVS